MPLSITYEKVDFQLLGPGLVAGWTAETRLVLSHWTPAYLMISSSVLYLLIVFVFAPATRPGANKQLIAATKQLRSLHNLVLCIFSTLTCGYTFYELSRTGELYDQTALLCTPNEGRMLRPLSIVFILSKAWEGLDTVFLVWLGKRPPQFLHVYHHATTFWLFCLVVNLPGPEKLGMLLNGFVHALMYSHYWRAWPTAIVPLITVLQIAQLAYCIYAYHITGRVCSAAAEAAGRDPPAFAIARTDHPLAYWTPYALVPVYLGFFLRFFAMRWLCPTAKSAETDAPPRTTPSITKRQKRA